MGRKDMCYCNPCCQVGTDVNALCQRLGPFQAVFQECLPVAQVTGSVVPFASGITPVALTSTAAGLVDTPYFIGFGTAVAGAILANNTINLTGLVNEAFAVPRQGEITAISATFTITVALDIPGTTTVTAQIYRAPNGSNIFSPTDAFVQLPLTNLITVGETLSGSMTLGNPVQVSQGDRLLLVYTLTGGTAAGAVTGTASAGITIA